MAQVTLKGARISAGYSQEELAKKLDISRDLIAKWETGKVKIRTINLYGFCLATGFDPADILLPS